MVLEMSIFLTLVILTAAAAMLRLRYYAARDTERVRLEDAVMSPWTWLAFYASPSIVSPIFLVALPVVYGRSDFDFRLLMIPLLLLLLVPGSFAAVICAAFGNPHTIEIVNRIPPAALIAAAVFVYAALFLFARLNERANHRWFGAALLTVFVAVSLPSVSWMIMEFFTPLTP